MLKEINEKIKNESLIIFGEMHGTKEIPEMLMQFFLDAAEHYNFNLCLEIPSEFQNQMDYFLESGDFNILKSISFFSKKNCSDGRNSLEYIQLIEAIYKINSIHKEKIRIFCIDPSANNQNEKEKKIAENIISLVKNKTLFAILGDIHASKKKVVLGKIKIISSGFLISKKLKEKMISIRIAPKNKELSEEEKNFNKGFDYIIEMPNITPCSFLE